MSKSKTPKSNQPTSSNDTDESEEFYDLEDVEEEDSFDEEAAVQTIQASIAQDDGDDTDFTEVATEVHFNPGAIQTGSHSNIIIASGSDDFEMDPQSTAELYDEPLTEFASEEQGHSLDHRSPPPNLAKIATAQQKQLVVGSSSDCDVVLSDESISPKHLHITSLGNGRFQLLDLGGPTGTYWLGNKITSETVTENEVIQLGSKSIEMSWLASFFHSDSTSPYQRSSTVVSLVIGREEPADLVLPQPVVSRRQAEIKLSVDGLLVRDLRSTNGTFIDGVRIGETFQLLAPASRLSFGSYRVPRNRVLAWRIWLNDAGDSTDKLGSGLALPESGENSDWSFSAIGHYLRRSICVLEPCSHCKAR